MVVFTRCV